MPFYPGEEGEREIPYTLKTRGEKLVMDYCHLNIAQVQELTIDTYLFLMREAVIYENSRTEAGREYLHDCWRIEQTKPDRKSIREKFKKREGGR